MSLEQESYFTKISYELPACCICVDECTGQLGALTCGHVFHYKCIEHWLDSRSFCPICKDKKSGYSIVKLNYEIIQKKTDNSNYFAKLFKCEDKELLSKLMVR